jgi:hypothetical protein
MAVLMYPLEIYSSHLENTLAMRLEIFLVLFAVIRLHLASGACKIRSGKLIIHCLSSILLLIKLLTLKYLFIRKLTNNE